MSLLYASRTEGGQKSGAHVASPLEAVSPVGKLLAGLAILTRANPALLAMRAAPRLISCTSPSLAHVAPFQTGIPTPILDDVWGVQSCACDAGREVAWISLEWRI
jgi:hypothetical protein